MACAGRRVSVLGCGESAGSSSSGVKVTPDSCVDRSSGFVGKYFGIAQATILDPADAGVSREEPSDRVEVASAYCNVLEVLADFGSACDKSRSPELKAAIQTPTSFVLLPDPAPFCLRSSKDRPGSAAFFIASGSVSGDTLALQVSGGVWFDGDAEGWPYSYTFTGTRSGP